jgi:peptidoglycan hydrolase CwlO-like protein
MTPPFPTIIRCIVEFVPVTGFGMIFKTLIVGVKNSNSTLNQVIIMKRKIITIIILPFSMLLITVVGAQNVVPAEGIIVHQDAPRSCWVVNLDPEPKTLKKAWQNYIKKEFDVKMKGAGLFLNNDLLSAEQVTLTSVSTDPLNLHTNIVEDINGSEMKVFAELKSDIYANRSSQAPAFRALREILEDFLAEYLPAYYHSRVTDAEKRLVELAEEREDLKKHIARDSEKIEELQNEIEQRQLELGSNQAKLDLAESKLEARKTKLERIRSQLR